LSGLESECIDVGKGPPTVENSTAIKRELSEIEVSEFKKCSRSLTNQNISDRRGDKFDDTVDKQELKDSIELNVFVSMKALSRHFEKYKDWRKVLGAYHTGKPVINWYAKKGTTMNYEEYWFPEPILPDSVKIDTTLIVNQQG
jgi:hypothetical protein